MAAGQITWEQFVVSNNDARGIRYKFEDLSRQLFIHEFLSGNSKYKYLHSNPNNPGVESEPILDEQNGKYIGYQAKFFDNNVDYGQIKSSAQKAIKEYKGTLDIIYLFCNKTLTTTCTGYRGVEKLLQDADIELQLITDTTILDLVRKYPILGQFYFDDHGISHEWLKDRASTIASILGERFNPDFNVDTEAEHHLSIFLHNQKALAYFNAKKEALIEEIDSLRWELDEWHDDIYKLSQFVERIPDVTFDCISEAENWQRNIGDEFKDTIVKIETRIKETEREYSEIRSTDPDKATEIGARLKNLNKLNDLFYRLELPKIERELVNNKILVVEGKAGVGKTQLFANETNSLLKANENALLVIGGDCLSDTNMLEQLKNNLRLNFDFENLIDILEVMGEASGKIVPIFIDALNESWKPALWKSILPILYKKITDYKYVRLAISFRSEYERVILPEEFFSLSDVKIIEHTGFNTNSFQATKQFLRHYGIPFTPLHMFDTNISNPLFLTLYCKTYRGDEVNLPVLYERLLEQANDKMHIKLAKPIENAGYDQSYNLVTPIVEGIAKQILLTGKRSLEKSEIEKMPIWNSLGLAARSCITQLIQENILQDKEIDGKFYVCFSFDQMNDYFSAKAIFSMFLTEKEIRNYVLENVLGIVNGSLTHWENKDLFAHVCALFAEKFEEECVDIIRLIDNDTDKADLFEAYIESFEWRSKIYLSLSELLELCHEFSIDPATLWNAFINNSVKADHLLNADRLYDVLKEYSIAERDYVWTIFINEMNSKYDRIVQLVEMYNKGETLEISDKEQIRLLLILFSWVLTSSNRYLRDITSKAMVELLKEHFEYNEYLLKLFSHINDPYVIQRLYGIAFGACVKRACENKEKYKKLVYFVFENIFNQDIVYPDILLRDYARLIIERYFIEYPSEIHDFEVEKIKPPYQSIQIPDVEDQKYADKDFQKGLSYIQFSMLFEGIGGYGDFGRYVFQSALRYFEVDDYKIFNYAMYYIIHELEYQGELFDNYDGRVKRFAYDRHNLLKIERIGKKYQWIAMYNILARVSDYCPMKTFYFAEDEVVAYDGPWEPYVRDFDPTLNIYNLSCDSAPYFSQVDEHMRQSIQEKNCEKENPLFDENAWIKSNSLFFESQKNDLILVDSDGIQWIVLSKYADTGRKNLETDKLMVWNWIYGYFVTDEQLVILKEYASKRRNLFYSNITTIPDAYVLYNREYPWSSGSKTIVEGQWYPVELETNETEVITETIEEARISELKSENGDGFEGFELLTEPKTYTKEMPVTIALGTMLNTTQYLTWEEEFDASKEDSSSYFHPCAEIINTLELRQKTYDGYYYSREGELIAFDTNLKGQKAGMVIRREALDKFLDIKNLHLAWFVNAAKEVHGGNAEITKYADWTGLLEYREGSVQGEYYIKESK